MKGNKYYHKFKFHIGKRIIKTTAAVYICFLIYQLRGQYDIPFYSAIAAVLCMQTSTQNSGRMAKERIQGTLIGAFYGVIILILARNHVLKEWILFLVMALCMIPIIQTSIHIKRASTAAISCVVFLSIAASYGSNASIWLITLDRIADTLIGIAVALFINSIKIPRRPRKNILFVLDIDHDDGKKRVPMSEYSKKEMSRMINDGANITISTEYSPAAIWEYLSDIDLQLPVIAMNGSVLYDLPECKYIRTYSLSSGISKKLVNILEENEIGYFVHSIIHDMLLIYVSEFRHMCMQDKYRKLRSSPYRNYIYGKLPDNQRAVYFYILDRVDVIDGFLKIIEKEEFRNDIYIDAVMESDYKGYKSASIYCKTASKEERIRYLMDETGTDQVVTIGSTSNSFDVVIEDGDENLAVKIIKRIYEAFFWEKKKRV